MGRRTRVDVAAIAREVEAARSGHAQPPPASSGGSPIEAMLRSALLEDGPRRWALEDCTRDTVEFHTDTHCLLCAPRDYQHTSDVLLFSQARIDGYRCDLLIWDTMTALAIECDGHEFHERTPQQASYDRARDRALLRAGVVTIRFTGSDIHRDVDQCADDVFVTLRALDTRLTTLRERSHRDGYAASELRRIDAIQLRAVRPRIKGTSTNPLEAGLLAVF